MGAWQFVYLFAAIPLGFALDRIGLVNALFAAAILISVSALLRAFAIDTLTLGLAVALFGIGGPLISVGAPKVISCCFNDDERALAMGIYMTGPALGGIFSLSLTNSVLMPYFNGQWRYVFLCYSALVFVAGVVWLIVNLRMRQQSKQLLSGSDISARNGGSGESRFSAFFKLCRLPVVQIVLLMSVFVFTYTHGLGNWLPSILQESGFSAAEAGYWSSIPTVVGVLASLTIPRLAKGSRRFLILGLVSLLAVLSLLGLLFLDGWMLLLALCAIGIVRGTLMTLCLLILMQTPSVGSRYMGIAGGLFFTFAEIGGVAGPSGIGYFRDSTGSFDLALMVLLGTTVVMLLLAVLTRYLSR